MTQPIQRPGGQDFLMGQAGPPSVSWKGAAVGTVVSGTIAAPPETVQQTDADTQKPLFWDDDPTKPKWQGVVRLARATYNGRAMVDPTNADDEGERRLFYKGVLRNAIRDAVMAVNAPGLEVGGTLTVTFLGKEAISKTADRNLYSASYTRPTGGETLGIPQAQPAAAPAAQPAATVTQLATQPAAPAAPALGSDGAPIAAPPGVDQALYDTHPAAVKTAMWSVASGEMVAAG